MTERSEGTGQPGTDVLNRPYPEPVRTIRYGDDPDQVIDMFGGPGPLIAFIHGGFWRPEYDRINGGAGSLAADLAGRGYTVAVIEYRRTGWPGTLDDVRAALDAVPGEKVLAGHSAGGHLALWAATGNAAPVLALAPVADLAEAYRRGTGNGAVAALLGGGPAEHPDRYAAAEPGAIDAPVRLVHGTADDRVPVELSRRYAAAHPNAQLIELPGVDHFEVIDPESSAWDQVIAALTALTNGPPKG